MGTGRGANETDFTCVCGAAEAVVIDSGAAAVEAEEARLTEEAVTEVFTELAVAALDTVNGGPEIAAVVEGSGVFAAKGREGRLPDRLDDSLTPDKELVGGAFELATVFVVDSDFRGSGLSSAVRISLNLAAAASRSFFKSS